MSELTWTMILVTANLVMSIMGFSAYFDGGAGTTTLTIAIMNFLAAFYLLFMPHK